MRVFGKLDPTARTALVALVAASNGMTVGRRLSGRSSTPFPSSNDLEGALVPAMTQQGFAHHVDVEHPDTRDRYEFDFFSAAQGIAIEIMGYRADDEIYKDLLKFHVHAPTRVGVVWVPRWKWISGVRSDANHRAAIKALAFAERHLALDALVAITYDWSEDDRGSWRLAYPGHT